MRVAYFINQYPKVSHSFIRREILALERQGLEVERIALRGWQDPVVDVEDKAEQTRTFHVLRQGLIGLASAMIGQAVRTPVAFMRALGQAWRMSRGSDRPLIYHLAYLAEACQVLAHLRHRPVRHIHAHFGTNSAEVVLLARTLGGPPYSFTAHGPEEFDRPEALHLREKIEKAAFVVAISSFGRSQLYRWVGHEHWPRIHVIHCGLDKGFHEDAEAVPLPDRHRLVCVGRLCEQKGQLILLEAVRQIRDRGIDFELVLAGDGEMRAEVEQLIEQHRLQDMVRITGWIDSEQVRQELQAARAMVLPSFAEGLPVVIMEAMALERPVVSTTVAGIPELVRQGVDGWLVAPGDADALTDALVQVLNADAEALRAMGREGRRRVTARHDVDLEATKLHLLIAGRT
ncbi:MAG TPA: glycosyltransferase family 4 protein [Hydrogenophaga sp.]|mgnify:CR=1 FL=1|uniref:glycosyltransferase family 4 protein n=1 Tax=Hydrogenophaga sp. TaxID=1904254 RepID=UPI002BD672E6|nr:glycosyltransferase family 4 protein [Hydrogenophaga sp.]HMN91991.1 glycosyltransferase family 4 protein [Hydrogenophaga sp.]HMP08793.1 glycosyltransferase family 4 protein [Hydrogenophaga sp.]